MALVKVKPTSAGRRGVVKVVNPALHKGRPFAKLVESQSKKAGRNKEALMAFLHVDVLYYSDADAHAEALANLAELWNTLQQTERAVRARRTLDERYPTSPFARR